MKLTRITVAGEMGKLCHDQDLSDETVDHYMRSLEEMKRDVNACAASFYKKICMQWAIGYGMKSFKDSQSDITTWKDIGWEFVTKPTWELAEQIFHIIYTSIELIVDFKTQVESSWMRRCAIEYYGDRPQGIKVVTGIEALVSAKINMMRKDMMRRLSSKHGFKIVKSLPMNDKKQAPRRGQHSFKQEFVKTIHNKGQDTSDVSIFDDYLRKINGNQYIEHCATTTSALFMKYKNEKIEKKEEMSVDNDQQTEKSDGRNNIGSKNNEKAYESIFQDPLTVTESQLGQIGINNRNDETSDEKDIASTTEDAMTANELQIKKISKEKRIVLKERKKIEDMQTDLTTKINELKELRQQEEVSNMLRKLRTSNPTNNKHKHENANTKKKVSCEVYML
jgi:hypothetical protein